MIIWIDGANGVGKSHVAAKLAELLAYRNAEYVESDLYWEDFRCNKNNFWEVISGAEPCKNKYFLSILREVLEKKRYDFGKILIVSMSLVDKLCEKELLDYFKKKKESMFHIILEAKEETIISRIENDPIRDKNAQNQQKPKVSWHIQHLETNYPDAVRINTEDKTLDEIVDEIMALL